MVDLVSLFYIRQQQSGSKPVARKQHKKKNAELKIGNSDFLYAMHHLTEFRDHVQNRSNSDHSVVYRNEELSHHIRWKDKPPYPSCLIKMALGIGRVAILCHELSHFVLARIVLA